MDIKNPSEAWVERSYCGDSMIMHAQPSYLTLEYISQGSLHKVKVDVVSDQIKWLHHGLPKRLCVKTPPCSQGHGNSERALAA